MPWKTARRTLDLSRPLVMGILNVTPDSFSDGGEFVALDDALRRAEQMIEDGVDIIDIGGESTRPGSGRVDADTELKRTLPVVSAITKRFETPVSIDTTKPLVAQAAIDNGAEIVNDISGLRWEVGLADVAARASAGLILMHSRGSFETMHSEPPVGNIFVEAKSDLTESISAAKQQGVSEEQIVLDPGIGFGKTFEQSLELLANLDRLVDEFAAYPMLVGASRKSFIGKILGDSRPSQRLGGSLAAAMAAVRRGAKIVRVHDVRETVAALGVFTAIENGGNHDES
ncbi:MAG: dihydropteroate synthase [Pyrinomonadaceae bacterium]|nr:dihydropteroate synthase [Pyrinomonadaceae bacterium]